MEEGDRLTCAVCGSGRNLSLVPSEGKDGTLIGFIFSCQGCLEKTDGCRITVHLGTDLLTEVNDFLGGGVS